MCVLSIEIGRASDSEGIKSRTSAKYWQVVLNCLGSNHAIKGISVLVLKPCGSHHRLGLKGEKFVTESINNVDNQVTVEFNRLGESAASHLQTDFINSGRRYQDIVAEVSYQLPGPRLPSGRVQSGPKHVVRVEEKSQSSSPRQAFISASEISSKSAGISKLG